jgi:prevent-host-death family protein
MNIAELRNNMAEPINKVLYQGERVVLHRRGKPVAVLVSLEDAELLERLENDAELREARKVLAEMKRKGEKPIPWEQIRKELKL